MVKITGTKEEVLLIIEMLDDTKSDATTYKCQPINEKSFCVNGAYKNHDLDFIVEYEFAELNSNTSKTLQVKECPYILIFDKNGWDMDYCIHCEGHGKYEKCLYLEENCKV